MNELKEMVSIVSRQGIRKLNVLTPSNKSGLLFELYEGIRTGKFKTDEEAIAKIYGEKNGKGAYVKLKNRLKNQLVNTMIFADDKPGLSERGLATLTCYRQFSLLWILLSNGGFQSGFSMGKRILKQSIKHELTDLNLLVAARMRLMSGRMGDKKKFSYYNDLVHKYQKIQHAELLASEYEENITIHFAKSRAAKTNLAVKAKEYAKELKKYTDSMESIALYSKAFNVFVLSHEIVGEYDEMRKICNEAVTYFENKKPPRKNGIFFFLFKSLGYYHKRKDFENGEKIMKKTIQYIDNKDSRNYFITIEQLILLSFICQKYKIAGEQYYAAIKRKGFELMLDTNKEHWKVYEAYLVFLERSGKLKVEENKKKTKFRLGKFLNDVPTFSKDKMGFNAAILIVQFLLLLQMNKYEKLIDQAEGLRIYAYRYLRKPETMRSFYFVKMMLEIINAQFHREAAVRKSEKYSKKMTSISAFDTTGPSIIEIIPYQELWKIVLSLLDTSIRKTKNRP